MSNQIDEIEALAGAPRPPWRDAAACRGMDPALFFPERGTPTADAKAVCRTCRVRSECLADALDARERFGIWGGYSERERRAMRRRLTHGADLSTVVADALRLEAEQRDARDARDTRGTRGTGSTGDAREAEEAA